MNTVHGGTIFMLPQSTQSPQRCSIGLHQIPKQWLESQIPLYLRLNLKLSDLFRQILNTALILLRNLAYFLYGVVDLHGA